jgi:protein-disulfide isomerase
MFRNFCLAHSLFARRNRTGLLLRLASVALLVAAVSAHAQFGAPQVGTNVKDASALKPPAGARIAIVEFADMECGACASANPLVKEAAAKYKIPWVRHDFLIPLHIWSTNAAINARWFDSKNKALGNEYRDQVFANQSAIYSLEMLSEFTQEFAKNHGITLPFSLDPQGKLRADVQADNEIGKSTGIHQTPTIFIVTSTAKGTAYVEVTDRSRLFEYVDQALANIRSAAPAKPVHR